MSDHPEGPGWWMASDYLWYPPELHPTALAKAAEEKAAAERLAAEAAEEKHRTAEAALLAQRARATSAQAPEFSSDQEEALALMAQQLTGVDVPAEGSANGDAATTPADAFATVAAAYLDARHQQARSGSSLVMTRSVPPAPAPGDTANPSARTTGGSNPPGTAGPDVLSSDPNPSKEDAVPNPGSSMFAPTGRTPSPVSSAIDLLQVIDSMPTDEEVSPEPEVRAPVVSAPSLLIDRRDGGGTHADFAELTAFAAEIGDQQATAETGENPGPAPVDPAVDPLAQGGALFQQALDSNHLGDNITVNYDGDDERNGSGPTPNSGSRGPTTSFSPSNPRPSSKVDPPPVVAGGGSSSSLPGPGVGDFIGASAKKARWRFKHKG